MSELRRDIDANFLKLERSRTDTLSMSKLRGAIYRKKRLYRRKERKKTEKNNKFFLILRTGNFFPSEYAPENFFRGELNHSNISKQNKYQKTMKKEQFIVMCSMKSNPEINFFKELSEFLLHNFENVDGKIYKLQGNNTLSISKDAVAKHSEISSNPIPKPPNVMTGKELFSLFMGDSNANKSEK